MNTLLARAAVATAFLAMALAPISASAAANPCPTVPTATDRCPTWTASYNNPTGRGGNGEDILRGATLSPAGDRIYASGTSFDDVTSYDAVVTAFDTTTHALVWSSRYDGPMRGYDTSSAVVVSPDGSTVFGTGRSQGPDGDFDFATIAYAASTGQQLWVSRYDDPQHMDDRPFTIAVSPDGSTVYAGGTVLDEANNADAGDYGVVAYDAHTGDQKWVSIYQGTAKQYDIIDKLTLSADGSRLYATGRSYGSTSGPDAATVALDTTDGSVVWVARYNGSGSGADEGLDLALTPDGSKLVVAAISATSSTGTNDWATIAYDTATGSQLWATRYNGGAAGTDTPAAVAVCGSKAFVAGSSGETGTGQDFSVAAYNLVDGTKAWQSKYATPGNWTDIPRGIAVNPACTKVYATGYSLYPRAEIQPIEHVEYGSYLTEALSATDGTTSWISRYSSSGHGDDVAQVALVAPNGQTVFIAGTFVYNGVYSLQLGTPPPYSFDYGIAAYAA